MTVWYNIVMTKKVEVIKGKPVKVCIACRTKVEEINYGKDFITCVNKQCPRFGLLTVVFAQLKKKHENENGKHENL